MSALEITPLDRWRFCGYFGGGPYRVGAALIGNSFSCARETPPSRRVGRLIVGALLLIPLVNSIVLVIFKRLGQSFEKMGLEERFMCTTAAKHILHPTKHGLFRTVLTDQMTRPPIALTRSKCALFLPQKNVTQEEVDNLEYWIEPYLSDVLRRTRKALEAAHAQQVELKKKCNDAFNFHSRSVPEGRSRKSNGKFNVKVIDDERHPKETEVVFTTQNGAGMALSPGIKKEMQDVAHSEVFSFVAGHKKQQAKITSIFDGHGDKGLECAQYMSAHLMKYLKGRLHVFNKKELSLRGIWNAKVAFVDLSRSYKGAGGTTANVCLEYGDELVCYNVGDSRALIFTSKGDTVQISEDAEFKIVKYQLNAQIYGALKRGHGVGLHPDLDGFRLETSLQPARTLGDHHYNNSARPKVTVVTRKEIEKRLGRSLEQGEKLYLLQASDGLFEVSHSDGIGAFAAALLKRGNTEAQAASKLIHTALLADSGDNLSVLIKEVFSVKKVR